MPGGWKAETHLLALYIDGFDKPLRIGNGQAARFGSKANPPADILLKSINIQSLYLFVAENFAYDELRPTS